MVSAFQIENATFCEAIVPALLGFGPLVIAVKLTGEGAQ